MKIIEIAEEIHRDLGSPDSISRGSIGFWLREHIGDINTLLGLDYEIINYEISPELGEKEKSIYKLLYEVFYYEFIIKKNYGAGAFDAIVEVTSDGATVRKISNNQAAQTFIQLKKQRALDLKTLINAYKSPGNIIPKQTVGDDTEEQTLFISSTNNGRNYYG